MNPNVDPSWGTGGAHEREAQRIGAHVDFAGWEMKNALQPTGWYYLNFMQDRAKRAAMIAKFRETLKSFGHIEHPLGERETVAG